jgi:hypothetical protein
MRKIKTNAFVAICLLAGQTAASAQSSCQHVTGSVCARGNGAISSITGDAAVRRGAGFSAASNGAGLSTGDRILTHDGAAVVKLGPGCFAPVGPHMIVTIVQQDGLTCLQGLDNRPPEGGFDTSLVGAGLVGAGGVAAAAVLLHNKKKHLSP